VLRAPPRTHSLAPACVPERRWNRNIAEASDEQTQVVLVALRPFVRKAEANLQLATEAAHASAADRADCLQVCGRVAAPRSPVLGQLLPPVALDVEHERMEVDLPAAPVAHDEASREPGIGS